MLTPFCWPVNQCASSMLILQGLGSDSSASIYTEDSFEYEYFALTPLIDDLHALGITFMDGSGTRWTRFEPVRKRWRRKRVLRLQPAMTENQDSAGISLDE